MRVKLFDAAIDSKEIESWLKMRKLDFDAKALPALGAIVPGVAAGFLRMCEGNYAVMDSIITHPLQPAATRDAALSVIMQRLLIEAEALGVKNVVGFTVEPYMIQRAVSLGFRVLTGWSVLTRGSSQNEP